MIFAQTWRVLLVVGMLGGGLAAFLSGDVLTGAAIHLLVVGYLLAGTLNPSSRLFGPIQVGIENEKAVWLTLDDGPDPVDTPAILDLLDEHQAKATFFVIGEKAERHPGLIREIRRRGHQLGNHSWSHPRASFWSLGPVATWREIAKCQRVIEGITGRAPEVFRAPVGHYNVFVHPVLRREGLKLVGWSSRGFDGVAASPGEVLRRIGASAEDGGIILAHEGTPITSEVVSGILAMGRERGWRFIIPGVAPESGSC